MYTFLVNNTEDPEGIVESSFILSVDTTHVWVSQDWDTSVTSGDGQTRASAYSVTQARELTDGTEGIWVCGYITVLTQEAPRIIPEASLPIPILLWQISPASRRQTKHYR